MNIYIFLGFTVVCINALIRPNFLTTVLTGAWKHLGITRRDTKYTVEALIKPYGYEMETHNITTTDGYILTLYRIRHGKTEKNNGKVAFLMHGLLLSSADWVVAGPEHSLAFTLADEGYDVWLGNGRGTTDSRKHVSLNPDKDEAYWQFSWHEIGIIDVPQMIDYVLNVTQLKQLYYVRHSQGTTTYYVMTSEIPNYNSKIKVQVSLAPIGYVNHVYSPLLQLGSQFTQPINMLFDTVGYNEFLPSTRFIQYILGDALCQEDSVTQFLCTNILFAINGFSRRQLNETLLPLVLQYSPAGCSTNQLVHFAQEIQSGYFRKFDYGLLGNTLKYGSVAPPSYDLTKITAPTYFIYSKNDWLASVPDVVRLCNDMINACQEKILVKDDKFNHLDFMYGIDNYELVNAHVLRIFSKYE